MKPAVYSPSSPSSQPEPTKTCGCRIVLAPIRALFSTTVWLPIKQPSPIEVSAPMTQYGPNTTCWPNQDRRRLAQGIVELLTIADENETLGAGLLRSVTDGCCRSQIAEEERENVRVSAVDGSGVQHRFSVNIGALCTEEFTYTRNVAASHRETQTPAIVTAALQWLRCCGDCAAGHGGCRATTAAGSAPTRRIFARPDPGRSSAG